MKLKLSSRLRASLLTLGLVCLLGGLAWTTHRFSTQLDITGNASNTLSEASQKVLSKLSDTVKITAYIKKEAGIRLQIEQLVDRYRFYKKDIVLTFVDPNSAPEKFRELNIGSDSGILVDYQGRTERLIYLDESTLTNALFQLAAVNERWVSFLSGHGERSVDGKANFDLATFAKALEQHKIRARTLSLANVSAVPDNSNLLVIATPQVALLDSELNLIKQYIDQGGSLLILTDPDNAPLKPLLDYIGVQVLPGKLVDGSYRNYGVDQFDPSFVVAGTYPAHPITKGFLLTTLFPVVSALEAQPTSLFIATPLLTSSKQSWTEMGEVSGKIRFDANTQERAGPLNFGYALVRDFNKDQEQRVVIMGDGDFLSNTYVGNVGNLDLGFRMINWLLHDDQFIDIPAKATTDSRLQLSNTSIALISLSFLIILPLFLLVTGFWIWRSRNRK